MSSSTISDIDTYISDNYVDEKSDHEYARGRNSHSMMSARMSMAAPSPMAYEDSDEPMDLFEEELSDLFGGKLIEEEPLVFSRPTIASQPSKKRSLDDILDRAGETFQESLFRIMDEKGLKPSQVYKDANLTKQTFSKIKKDREYHPSRETAFALALALRLNLDEMFDFDRDGHLDPMERTMQLDFEMRMGDEDYDSDSDEEEFFDELEEETGIDRDEWELMDDEERAEALEEAGLDPDVFDEY